MATGGGNVPELKGKTQSVLQDLLSEVKSMGSGGSTKANIEITADSKDFDKVNKHVQDEIKKTQKMSSQEMQFNISNKDIFDSKKIKGRVEELSSEMSSILQRAYSNNPDDKLKKADVRAYMTDYIELSQYMKQVGQEVEQQYTDLFQAIQKAAQAGKTGGFLKYGMKEAEIRDIYDKSISSYQDAGKRKFSENWNSAQRQVTQDMQIQAQAQEAEQTWQRMSQKMDEYKAKAEELQKTLSQAMSQDVSGSQDDAFLAGKLEEIIRIRQEANDLRNDLMQLTSDIPAERRGAKQDTLDQLANVNQVYDQAQQQVDTITEIRQQIAAAAEESRRVAEEEIEKNVKQIEEMMRGDEDFQYAKIEWIEEYKERIRQGGEEVSDVYEEFKARVNEAKNKALQFENANGKANEIDQFLEQIAGGDKSKLKEYRSRFINEINAFYNDVNLSVADVKEKIAKELGLDYGNGAFGEGGGLGDGMQQESDSIRSGAEQIRDAADEAAKAYETVAEIKERARQDYQSNYRFTIDDDYDFNQAVDSWTQEIDSAEDRIKELSRVSRMLQEQKSEIESNLRRSESDYNYAVESGDEYNIRSSADAIEEYYQNLLKVQDLHSYVTKELDTELTNFKPSSSWDERNISALIVLLQQLSDEVHQLATAFGTIDEESGVTNLLSQFKNVGDIIQDAFNSEALISFNSNLDVMVDKLTKIYSSVGSRIQNKVGKSTLNVALNDQSALDVEQKKKKEELFWSQQTTSYMKQYNKIFDAAKKAGYSTTDVFTQMMQSRSIQESFVTPDRLMDQFGLPSIQLLEEGRSRIERIMQFLDLFQKAQNEIQNSWNYEDTGFDKLLGRVKIGRRSSMEYLDAQVKEIYDLKQKREPGEVDVQKALQDALANGNLGKGELNAEELANQYKLLMQAVLNLQSVMKQGFGLKEVEGQQGEFTSFLSQIVEKLNAAEQAAIALTNALKGVFLGEEGEIDIAGRIKEQLEAGNPYQIEIQPKDGLAAAIQSMLDENKFKIDLETAGLTGKGGESPAELITQMVGADAVMGLVNGKDSLRERGMAFNSKTGYHTNPFIFDKNGSFSSDLTDAIMSNVTEEVDTWMHTHPELFPAFSLANKKENGGYSSDLRASYTAYKKGINTEINAAQNQVAVFDAQSFYDAYGELFDDANIEQTMQKIYEARTQVEEKFRTSFKSLSEVFNIESFSIPLEELLGQNFDLPELAPKFQEMLSKLWKDSLGRFDQSAFTGEFMQYIDSLPLDYGKSIKEVFIEFIRKSFENGGIDPAEIQSYLGDGADFGKAISTSFGTWFGNLIKSESYLPRIQQLITPEILQNAIGVQDFNEKYMKYFSIDQFKQSWGITGGKTDPYSDISAAAARAASAKKEFAEKNQEAASSVDPTVGKLKEESLEFNETEQSAKGAADAKSKFAEENKNVAATEALTQEEKLQAESSSIASQMQKDFKLTAETATELTSAISDMIEELSKGNSVNLDNIENILRRDEKLIRESRTPSTDDAKEIRDFLSSNPIYPTQDLKDEFGAKYLNTYMRFKLGPKSIAKTGTPLDQLIMSMQSNNIAMGVDATAARPDQLQQLLNSVEGTGASYIKEYVDQIMQEIFSGISDRLMKAASTVVGSSSGIGRVLDKGEFPPYPEDDEGYIDISKIDTSVWWEQQPSGKTGDRTTFAADISKLEGYQDANQDFINNIIASVLTGEKEYDAAMEEFKAHIAQKQEEIKAQQERNTRAWEEINKFTSGAKPILEAMGLSEGEVAPAPYSQLLDKVNNELYSGEQAVQDFAKAVGYAFDEVNQKWEKIGEKQGAGTERTVQTALQELANTRAVIDSLPESSIIDGSLDQYIQKIKELEAELETIAGTSEEVKKFKDWIPESEDGISAKTFDDTAKFYDSVLESVRSGALSATDAIRIMNGELESAASKNLDPYGAKLLDKAPEGWSKIEGAPIVKEGYEWYSNGKNIGDQGYEQALIRIAEAHEQAAAAAGDHAAQENNVNDAIGNQPGTGSNSATQANEEQEQSANGATNAEENLKNTTEQASGAGGGSNAATGANREQEESARKAADEQERLRILSEKHAGGTKTIKYEESLGYTRVERYHYNNEDDPLNPGHPVGWEQVANEKLVDYTVLLNKSIDLLTKLKTAQAALAVEQAKTNPSQEIQDAINAEITYYNTAIQKNDELAKKYAAMSNTRVLFMQQNGKDSYIPYNKKQYDTDLEKAKQQIDLKIGEQSARQLEAQRIKNAAELAKEQKEIEKANHWVTAQMENLKDVIHTYNTLVNPEASRGITAGLPEFKEKTGNIAALLHGMKGTPLDADKQDLFTSMFRDLKRTGNDAYLAETAKKADLSRQKVDNMRTALGENINSFLSDISMSKGAEDQLDALRQKVEDLKASLQSLETGSQITDAFSNLKTYKTELVAINHEARAQAAQQKEITAEYNKNVDAITALGKARSDVNTTRAEGLTDKQGTLTMTEALDQLAEASQKAQTAYQNLIQMWLDNKITDEQFQKAFDLYGSEGIQQGSRKSIQEELKAIQNVVNELAESYIKLADAEEKAQFGKTSSGRKIAELQKAEIEARQTVLKGRIDNLKKSGDYTDQFWKEMDKAIESGKTIGGLKRTEYEEKRNAVVNTKGLGFGDTDNVEKTWDTLIQKASQYEQIINKQQTGGSLTVNEEETLRRLAPLYDEAGNHAQDAANKFREVEDARAEAQNIIATQSIEKYEKMIGDLDAKSPTMPQAYKDQVDQLQQSLQSLKSLDFGNSDWYQQIQMIEQGLTNIKTDKFMQPLNELSQATLDRRMSDWISKNSGAGEYIDQVRQLQAALAQASSAGDLDKISVGFEKVKASAADASKTGLSFTDGLINRFKSLGQYLLSFASFYRIIGTIKKAVNIVKELDTAMMELKKVSSETADAYNSFQARSFDLADQVGGTAQQIIQSTAAWKRLGKSFEESQEAAQASVKLLNVSEFTNIDDATTSLVSMKQAFQDLTYEDFIDKLNGVGDAFSSSTDQLAQGMKNVSAVLKTQGNDIDQSLALLTAANNVTQDISKASMGVRTVALRLAGTQEAKQELEDLGEDASDFVVQTQSKVDAQIRKFTATASNPNGISVLDPNGRLRDTYDVLLDIAKVWQEIVEKDDKMGTNTSNALLELMAGKTRSNILASILQSPDILEQAYETSKTSKGIGDRELGIYMESMEAKLAQLQNRLQELAASAADSGFLKGFISGLTKILELVNNIVKTFGTLPTILGVVAGFFSQKNGKGLFGFDKQAKGVDKLALLPGLTGRSGDVRWKSRTSSTVQSEEVKDALETAKGKGSVQNALVQSPEQTKEAEKQIENIQNKAEETTKTIQEGAQKTGRITVMQAKNASEKITDEMTDASDSAKIEPTVKVDEKQVAKEVQKATNAVEQETQSPSSPHFMTNGGAYMRRNPLLDQHSNVPQATPEVDQESLNRNVQGATTEAAENAEATVKLNAEMNPEDVTNAAQQATEEATKQSSGAKPALLVNGGQPQGQPEGQPSGDQEAQQQLTIGQKIKGKLSKLGNGVGSILTNAISGAITGMAVTAISSGISFLVSKAYQAYEKTTAKYKINKGKEAQSNITQIEKQFNSAQEAADNFNDSADRYFELKRKNDAGLISTEEYQEFANINNSLAEQFPTLVAGFDEQGNAILNLGDNAEVAAAKINSLLDSEREVSLYKISEELPDVIEGTKESQEQIRKDAKQYQDVLDMMNVVNKPIDEQFRSFNAIPEEVYDNKKVNDFLDKYLEKVREVYGYAHFAGDTISGAGDYGYFLDLGEANTKEKDKELNEALKKWYDEEISKDIPGILKAQNKASQEIKAEWNKVAPSLISQMDLYDEFSNLGEQGAAGEKVQQLIRDQISNMNLIDLSNEETEEFEKNSRKFLKERFIDPIYDAISDSSGEIDKSKMNIVSDILSFEGTDKTATEYQEKINGFIDQLAESEEKRKQIRIILGVSYEDESGNEILKTDEQNQKLYDYFGIDEEGNTTGNITKSTINNMTLGQKNALEEMIASGEEGEKIDPDNIMPENLIKRIDAYIKKQKELKAEATDTLVDVFNKEDYKENAQQYESNLSSTTSALEKLRSEGSLTADEMVKLQQSFPDLTDFSYEGISKAGTKELNNWINELTDNWKDFTPEGLEQLDTYVKNLTLSYSDLSVSASDAQKAVIDSLMNSDRFSGIVGPEKTDVVYSQYESQINALKDVYGEDLNWNIILSLQDYFSEDAQTIIDKYGDYEIVWNIKLQNEDVQKDIEKLTSDRQLGDARRSLKQATGQRLTREDYDEDSLISRYLIEDYKAQIRNAKKIYNKSSKTDSDKALRDRTINELMASIFGEQQHIAENERAEETLDFVPAENELQKLQNEANEIQRTIDEATKQGVEVSADMYQKNISNAEKQIEKNQELADGYAELAEQHKNDDDQTLYLEYASKANEYASSVSNLTGNILEWRDAMNSIDNTHLSNAMTQLQNQAEDLQRGLTDATAGEKAVVYVELQMNADEQKQNLLEQRQALIDDFNKKNDLRKATQIQLGEEATGFTVNDSAYIEYQENLRNIDEQLNSVADSQREWADALLSTPIDAVNEKIEEYERKLQDLQDNLRIREAKGGRKGKEDYDAEQEIYMQEYGANTILAGLSGAKAGIANIFGWDDMAKEAEKQQAEYISSGKGNLADMYSSQKEENELHLRDLNEQSAEIQRTMDETQRSIDNTLEDGGDVTSEQYKSLISSGDNYIKKQKEIVEENERLLSKLGPERNDKNAVAWDEYTENIETAKDNIDSTTDSQREWNRSLAETDKGIPKINRNITNLANTTHDLSSKIQDDENLFGRGKNGDYLALANAQMADAEEQERLARLYDSLSRTASKRSDKEYWADLANQAQDQAIQDRADYLENILKPLQNDEIDLQNKQADIEREITIAEQKRQKVGKQTYRDLIKNGKEQIETLKKEQELLKDNPDRWREVQDSIDQVNDSIYDWQQSLDNITFDQASELASAISTAMSESVSETGMTNETIDSLIKGFSDLTGKDLDKSDLFYNTADGVKANTDALQELTQAEFELQQTNLADEIDAQREAMENAPNQTLYDAAKEKLEQLMQTQAQYFAQYEEMQKALSKNAAIGLAESTENAGANYDANYSRVQTYKDAYEKGLVGTDEFKAWTAYGDKFGRDTYEAYEGVMEKFTRYFTEDASTGIQNFLEDLQAKGLAKYSDEEGWSTLFENEEEAAMKMDMGEEFFHDMFGKLQDLGGYYSKVGSEMEYGLNKSDLNQQLKDALQTYVEMEKSGSATTEELEAQKQVISDIRTQLSDNEVNRDNFLKDQEEQRIKDYASLKDNLKMYQQLYDEATSDEEKNAIRKMAEKEIRQYGYDLKEGEIALSEKAQKDYDSRVRSGSFESPLSAETFGYTHNQDNSGDLYDHMVQNVTERRDEISGLTDQLSNYSREELLAIDHADGAWSDGEETLEQLCDTLDVSYDNASLLIDALAGLGLIDSPEVVESIPDAIKEGKEAVEAFLDSDVGKMFTGFDLDSDVSKMEGTALENRIKTLKQIKEQTGVEAAEYLDSKIQEAEVQLDIKAKLDSDYTLSQLKDLAQDDTKLAEAFNIDVDTEEGQAKLAELKNQIDGMSDGVDMVVRVDDTQFEQLIEAITGEDYEAWVKFHTDDQEVTTTENEIENEEVVVPVKYEGTTGSDGHTPYKPGQSEQEKAAMADTFNGAVEKGKNFFNAVGDVVEDAWNNGMEYIEESEKYAFKAARAEAADTSPTSKSTFNPHMGETFFGGQNGMASIVAQESSRIGSSYEQIDTNLLIPAIANYISEYYRAIDSGFEQEFSNGFDSTYGNIDMNNRPLIQWTQEAIDHYKEQLASWTYEDEPNGYQPEIGSYDTVHGGSDRFGEDILETGVEVAFTPMMKTEDGSTEFLGKDTVYDYIEDLVGKATENGQFSEEKLLAMDADKQHGGLGIIAGADTSLNYDPYDPNANKAFRYGEMMHFAGDYGAKQLAINQLNTAGVDEQFVLSQIQSLETLATLYDQDAEKAQGYFDVLMNTPTDELQQIILSNGAYDTTNIAAENALQGIADQAGISKDEVLQLLDVIKQLNQQNIEQPEGSSRQPDTGVSSTEVPSTGEEGERIITFKAVVEDDQVESDVAQIRNDVESTKIEITPELMVSNLLSKAQSFLSSIQGKVAGAMSSQPSQPSQPQSTEATATMDTSGVDKGAAKVDKAMNSLGKETATARVNVDIGQAMAAISSVRANLMTISGISVNINANSSSLVTAAGRASNLSQKLSEVIAKKNQAGMAAGTAYANGTVGIGHKINGIISHALDDGTVDEDEFEEVEFDAFANGKSQDWTAGKNEKALVNELGQESRVRDGVWELIPGGPHVEDIKKDDIIFNVQQTKDLLMHGRTQNSGKLVAHANGTVPGMSAYSASSSKYTQKTKGSSAKNGGKSSGGGSGKGSSKGKNRKKKKSTKKKDAALENFQKFLEKLFDWVEVRLDRIQRKIDLSTAKAENAIGWNSKNTNISNAMNQIAKAAADVNKVQIVRNDLGEVTGVNGVKGYSAKRVTNKKTGKTTIEWDRVGDRTLINDSAAGAWRYQQQANEVLDYATKSHTVKKKGKKKKVKAIISKKQAEDIRRKVADGTIDISKYSKKVQEVITNYKEWFDKSQDLIQSTEELKQQYKELQQQKLDNITEHYEAWAGYADAVKQSSEATSKLLTAQGKEVNDQGQRDAYNAQLNRQREITSLYEQEKIAYNQELNNAATVFGVDSKEYKEAQTALEGIQKQLTESQTAEIELKEAIFDLDVTIHNYVIDRLKAFVDKISSIVSLTEKRGKNNALGYKGVQESDYSDQITYNESIIKEYQTTIDLANEKIKDMGYEVGSEKYQEQYKIITDSENAILSLLSSNEDLKQSIRTLRWKPYEELREKIKQIGSDLDHLQGFIRDDELMDEFGQFTDRGYAQMAIYAEQMDLAERNIRDAEVAMQILNAELSRGQINQEQFNEGIKEQTDIIQDASESLYDYKTKLADLYIKQITKENDMLQELIDKRKDALSAKKAYYDYDKQIKAKNKDIAQLRAQINALAGVTGDATKARRAKLEAELKEKEEDLTDTRYEHQVEMQQQGFDKLSDDMQKVLDDAINAVNGNHEELMKVAGAMLMQLAKNGGDTGKTLEQILKENSSKVSNETESAIADLKNSGASKVTVQVGLDVSTGKLDTETAVNNRKIDSEVHGINVANAYVPSADVQNIESGIKNNNNTNTTVNQAKQNEATRIVKEAKDAKDAAARATAAAAEDAKRKKKEELQQQIKAQNSLLYDLDTRIGLVSRFVTRGASQSEARKEVQPVLKDLQKKADAARFEQREEIRRQIERISSNPEEYINDHVKEYQNELKDLKARRAAALSNIQQLQTQLQSLATGTKRFGKNGFAWTNENLKNGSELIIRPSDGAILTPLKANDAVIPANLANNLFKWGAINPDSFAVNPFMGKWGENAGNKNSEVFSNNTTTQSINLSFDSLFHIDGNVDSDVVDRLEDLGKSLTKNKEFQQNVINFVTRNYVKESRKQGFR